MGVRFRLSNRMSNYAFEDTSGGYGGYDQSQYGQSQYDQSQAPPPNPQTPDQQMFNPNQAAQMFGNQQFQQMGMQMGQQFIGQQADLIKSKAEQYIPTTKLRYLFAVDNSYVFNKLKIILLPWFQNEWHLKYQTDQNNPIAPRDDVNAHDMYIPTMGFITYILLAGWSLGSAGEFDPARLGDIASAATGWLVLEVFLTLMALFLLQTNAELGYLDIIAFAGYKFVPIIAALTAGIVSQNHALFLGVGVYGCAALCVFLVRSLKIRVQSNASAAHGQYQQGDTRRQYLTLGIAMVQPLLCYVLTRNLSPK